MLVELTEGDGKWLRENLGGSEGGRGHGKSGQEGLSSAVSVALLINEGRVGWLCGHARPSLGQYDVVVRRNFLAPG